jgi:hypothetical protein
MIRQSRDREESKKQPRRATDVPRCQARETEETGTGIFDDGDDLDPADFFDPEDLGIRART